MLIIGIEGTYGEVISPNNATGIILRPIGTRMGLDGRVGEQSCFQSWWKSPASPSVEATLSVAAMKQLRIFNSF